MKKNDIYISVIITTFKKDWNILKCAIYSILKTKYKFYEIFIIDQNMDLKIHNKILVLMKKYNQIKYIKSIKKGISVNRNIGIKRANGKWLLFMDDDAIIKSNFFNKIINELKIFEQDTYIGAVWGKVLSLNDNKLYLKKMKLATNKLSYWNFDSVCSIGIFFKKCIFNKIGYFNKKFGAGAKFYSGEETDMIMKLLINNYKILNLKGLEIYHPAPMILDFKKKFLYGIGLGKIYRKYIFSKWFLFFIFFIKILLIDISLRILFSLKAYHDLKSSIYFIKGLLYGFLKKH